MLLLSLLKLCPAEQPDCVCLIPLCLLRRLGLALMLPPPVPSFDCSFPPHLGRGCSHVLSHAGEPGLKVGIIEEKAHREPGALPGGSASRLPRARAGPEVPGGGGAGMGSATLSPRTEELAGGGGVVCRFSGTSATFLLCLLLGAFSAFVIVFRAVIGCCHLLCYAPEVPNWLVPSLEAPIAHPRLFQDCSYLMAHTER